MMTNPAKGYVRPDADIGMSEAVSPQATMRFAFETVLWGRRIDDLDLTLDVIQAYHFTGVELSQRPRDIYVMSADGSRCQIRDVHELLEKLRSRGLELVSLAGGPLWERLAFLQGYPVAELDNLSDDVSQWFDEGKAVLRLPFLYIDDVDLDHPGTQKANDASLAAWLLCPGISTHVFALHPHWFFHIRSSKEFRQRLAKYLWLHRRKGTGRLKLLADTAHLTICRENAGAVIRRFSGHLAAIHLKEWLPYYGRFSQRYAQGFRPLGEGDGTVDIEGALQAMDSIRYEGWVVIEQDHPVNTPVETVAKCARWLASRSLISLVDESLHAELMQREAESRIRDVASDDADLRAKELFHREVIFTRTLLRATQLSPAYFYKRAITAFSEIGNVLAAKLYSFNPRRDELYLLARTPQPEVQCTGILETLNSLCGCVVTDQRIQAFDVHDKVIRDKFVEQQYLLALPAECRWMIIVPVYNPSNTYHLRHLLLLFTRDDDAPLWHQPENHRMLERLAMLMSRMADHSINVACSTMATKTNLVCGSAISQEDFLEKLRDMLQVAFSCEAVSIFLADQSDQRLEIDEVHGTTGLYWRKDIKPEERYYSKGIGVTGSVWRDCDMVMLPNGNYKAPPNGQWVTTDRTKSKGRYECILGAMARTAGQVMGVIRLTNKTGSLDNISASTMFTDDDAAVLDSIIQSALPYLELLTLQQRQKEMIQRMTHELLAPLGTIGSAVGLMHTFWKRDGHDPRKMFDGAPLSDDIAGWAQLCRNIVSNARIAAGKEEQIRLNAKEKVGVRTDLVIPAIKQLTVMEAEWNITKKNIDIQHCEDKPALHLDKGRMQQVILNLLTNAIKYSGSSELRVQISTTFAGTKFEIRFSDWGIGVPPELRERIFLPGFRSKEASRIDVSGLGIGLAVVRAIIQAHGGEIRLVACAKPTQFLISLPLDLAYRPPK